MHGAAKWIAVGGETPREVELCAGLLEARADAVVVLDADGRAERANAVARALLGLENGACPQLRIDPQGRLRALDAAGGLLLLDIEETPLEGSRRLLSLQEPRDRFARGLATMSEVLLTGRGEEPILEALAAVTGRSLDLDRSLIYEARFDTREAVALSEWLNPDIDVAPTKGVYPLAVFEAGARWMREHRTWLVSHRDDPHPAMLEDGSAEVLHGAMAIQSLLWVPFGFREHRFYGLVFNQVTAKRTWLPPEIEYLQVATSQVTLALRQVAWNEERARSERALAEAQKAETIGLLAGGVAHDLAGHLGIVLGNLDRARRVLPASVPIAPLLRDAAGAAVEAASLAKHLLAYSGKGQLVVEPVDVAALVLAMRGLLHAAAGGVQLRTEVADEPAWVVGDATQLRQVVMNLVVNGVQAIGDRPGAVTVAVRVTSEGNAASRSTSGHAVVLEVSDTGCGMTDDVAQRALEPFFSTKGTGRGLGLAAAAGIVRAHGGDLRIDSEVGVGTSFVLAFPATEPGREEAVEEPDTAPASVGSTVVVVAEDVALLREVTAGLLRDLGYQVATAADGEEALALLDRRGDVDLLVMDWSMPAGGERLVEQARARRPDLAIVVTSGYAEGSVAAPRQPGTAFLEKPFRAEQLEGVVRQALAGRSRAA